MNGKIKTLAVAVGLVVAFGGGWLVAQVQNIDKVTPAQVWTDEWISDVVQLTGGGHRTTLMPPDKTQLLIGYGLNSYSSVVGRLYDRLPKIRKQQLLFYIPAARAIASAQQGPGPMQDRYNLSTLVDCMQKAQSQSGSVSKCIENHKK